ncbi:hypothetical protein ACFQS2_06080 [Brachybacterium sp. GCM10030267]|uniref:hypothetical protein n=1 Tax=Brachybacterium sp. GCM10030267 TaxID=3273381 RepID=UPI00361D5C4C
MTERTERDESRGEREYKRVRLTGARFEGGRLPVDSLVELQNYQEIVRLAAEARWQQEHPDESVPEEVSNSARLTIDQIDDGSADVFLMFEQQVIYSEYQSEAQDVADRYIEAAYSESGNVDLEKSFGKSDRSIREAVSRFGETLTDEQSIEYYPSRPDSLPSSITNETRSRALEYLFRAEDFLETPPSAEESGLLKSHRSLVGRITALNADKKTYQFVVQDGDEIRGRYPATPELLEDLREVVNSSEEGPLTRITGELQYKDGAPWRFWQTDLVEKVEFDNSVWGNRLRGFAALGPEWDGGNALQVTSVALDAASKLIEKMRHADIEMPSVFPTEEGGVLFEWGDRAGVRNIEVLEDGTFEMFAIERGQRAGEHSESDDLTDALRFAGVSVS